MSGDEGTVELEQELRAMFRRREGDVRVDGPVTISTTPVVLAEAPEARPSRWLPRAVAAAACIAIAVLVAVVVTDDGPRSVGTDGTLVPPQAPVTNAEGDVVQRVWDVEGPDGRAYQVEQVVPLGRPEVGFNLVEDGVDLFGVVVDRDCVGQVTATYRLNPGPNGTEIVGGMPADATGVELTFGDGSVRSAEAIGGPDLPVAFFRVADAPGAPTAVRVLGASSSPSCS